MADLKEPRSRHCLMLGGRSLYNLAPKLAIENLKQFFDSLSPSLLQSRFHMGGHVGKLYP